MSSRADLERADAGPVSFDPDEQYSRKQLAEMIAERDAEIAHLRALLDEVNAGVPA